MCNRLTRKGLIGREEHAEDRRAAWIVLTGPGRDLVDSAMKRRREAIAELVADLTLTRPVAFAGVLNALVEAAGELPGAEWERRRNSRA